MKLTLISVYDRIQIIAFALQELIISGIYMYEAREFLKTCTMTNKERNRQIIKHLIFANLFIICLDLTVLGMQCGGLWVISNICSACVYGIKLRVEFSILNRLVSITQKPTHIFTTD